jgi:hypothetical protein
MFFLLIQMMVIALYFNFFILTINVYALQKDVYAHVSKLFFIYLFSTCVYE